MSCRTNGPVRKEFAGGTSLPGNLIANRLRGVRLGYI